MKKQITIMLTTVLASLFLFSGFAFGEYYNRDCGYDDYAYDNYEYRFDDAEYQLDRYRGSVYYFHHPRTDVYFVLVGDTTFVVPAFTFRAYLHRYNFVLVPRTRFISLSCCGLDYYDSYLRFNFYFDFYNRSKWNRGHHYQLRRDFRSYYNNRKQQKWYHSNRQRIMQQIGLNSHNYGYGHSYPAQERQRINGYKKYEYYNHSGSRNYNKSHSSSKMQYNSRNYNSSRSSLKKVYNGSTNYKSHVKSSKKQVKSSRYSNHDRIKRKNEKR